MVVLTLTPYRGNHARFFPHTGHLGVTPVLLQGVVRTALEEDRKALKASSVSIRVRCYEADVSNVPSTKGKKRAPRVIYELDQEIWRKEDDEEWGTLGNWSMPWRVVLPTDAGGVTTTTLKTWKSWWQVEAVIVHKRSAILGRTMKASHQLPLTRYSAPSFTLPAASWSSSSSAASSSTLSPPHPSSKPPTPPPHLRGLQYSIEASTGVLGPNDSLQIKLAFHRDDPSILIKKVQVSVDRHIEVDHSAVSPVGSDDDETLVAMSDEEDLYSPSILENESTPSSRSGPKSLNRWRRSPLPTPPAAAGESGGYFAPRTSGGMSPENDSPLLSAGRAPVPVLAFELDDVPVGAEVVLAGNLPQAKSLFRYSVGETMRTKLANVWFTVSVKITVKSSSGAMEILELEPRTVVVSSASNAERESALAQAHRLLALANAEVRLYQAAAPIVPLFSPTHVPRTSAPSARRRRSDQWEGQEAPLKSKPRVDRGSIGSDALAASYPPASSSSTPLDERRTSVTSKRSSTDSVKSFRTFWDDSSPSEPVAPLPLPSSHHDPAYFPLALPPPSHKHSDRRSSSTLKPGPYKSSQRPSTSSGISASSYPSSNGRFAREQSAPLPSSSSSSLQQDILLPLSLYSSHPPPLLPLPESAPLTEEAVTSPASPAMSNFSSASFDALSPRTAESSPEMSPEMVFHAYTTDSPVLEALEDSFLPGTSPHSPFSKAASRFASVRPQSADADSGRRKTSFGMFSKPSEEEDGNAAKQGGKWGGFLRRSAKV
ncbi:hypothetical protein RQP46_010050 [Phenoliferia psychrophenolica]